MIKVLGPRVRIFWAAFTKFSSPESKRASSSLMVRTSTSLMASSKSGKAFSIQKFMVSSTMSLGRWGNWANTRFCTAGTRLPSIR